MGWHWGGEDGLTLVELMIAMVLSLVLMSAVYLAYQVQHKTSLEQDAVSVMQQDQRAAMELIAKDIKTAGCNPTNADIVSPKLGVVRTTAPATSLGLVMDIAGSGATPDDPDGKIVAPGEYVVYTRDREKNTIIRSDRSAGSVPSLIASNVTTFGFAYYWGTMGLTHDKAHIFVPSVDDSNKTVAIRITIGSTVIKNGVEYNRRLVRTVRLRNCDHGGD